MCAALAAGSGSWGRYLVSCLPCFPLPAPRVLRCVWRAVPSGCPLFSLAGTPFHAVCAFCGLGPVALLVYLPRVFCVCVRSRSCGVRSPPPLLDGVARALCAVRDAGRWWGRSTRSVPLRVSCLGPVLRLACGGGEGVPVSFPPYLAWGCALPVGLVCACREFQRLGFGGGWAACAPYPPTVRPGGAVGRGVALPRAVPLPSLGRHQSGCPWRRSGHGGRGPHTAAVRARLAVPARSVWRPGVLAWVCLFFVVPAGAGGWGVGAGPAPAYLSGAAVLAGGGGIIPSASGGWGPAPPWLAGRWGGVGGQGGGAPWPSRSLSGGGGLRLPTQPPVRRRHMLPWRTRSGAACRRQASLAGGGGMGGP